MSKCRKLSDPFYDTIRQRFKGSRPTRAPICLCHTEEATSAMALLVRLHLDQHSKDLAIIICGLKNQPKSQSWRSEEMVIVTHGALHAKWIIYSFTVARLSLLFHF